MLNVGYESCKLDLDLRDWCSAEKKSLKLRSYSEVSIVSTSIVGFSKALYSLTIIRHTSFSPLYCTTIV